MDLRFDRKKFFDEFRAWRGSVTNQQVRGLTFLLDCIEADPYIRRIDWAAYMLATAMHETAFTFMPIHEYGGHAYFVNRYGGQTKKGRDLGNDTPEEGYDYAGKGDVQLTGESNYEKAEIALRREYPALIAEFEAETGKRFDLTVGDQPNDKDDPKNAQNPKIAYAIMSYGMRTGMFTRYKLADFFNDRLRDPVNARKIINGLDKAETIAGYARTFDRILRRSAMSPQPLPITEAEHSSLEKGLEDALPTEPVKTVSEPTQGENTATSGEGGTSQAAGAIINTGDKTVPDNFTPENKTIQAPPPSNMLQRAKGWILGLGLIPTTGAGIVEAARNWIADGTLNIADIFQVVKQVFIFLLPYIFWVAIAFIVFWGIKELLKQISFIVNHYTLARGDMNNVKVVPATEPPPKGSWIGSFLPKFREPVSAVDAVESDSIIAKGGGFVVIK